MTEALREGPSVARRSSSLLLHPFIDANCLRKRWESASLITSFDGIKRFNWCESGLGNTAVDGVLNVTATSKASDARAGRTYGERLHYCSLGYSCLGLVVGT